VLPVPVSLFGAGIGEHLTKISLPKKWFLLVYSAIKISTKNIFMHPDLPRDTKKINVVDYTPKFGRNDCQDLICKLYPEIKDIINFLSNSAPTRLTGTGSTVFAICDNQDQAQTLQAKLPKKWQDWSMVVQGL